MPELTVPRVPHSVMLACGLAVLAALIHVQAALDHFSEFMPYAIAFIVLAAGQTTWAMVAYRAPNRATLIAGAVGSAVIVLTWLVSRTAGLPIGPEPGVPEPVGLIDVAATLDELVVIALAVMALSGRARVAGAAGAGAERGVITTALGLIALSTLVLAGGLHAH